MCVSTLLFLLGILVVSLFKQVYIYIHNTDKMIAQIYRENDKPYYRVGNAVLIAICAFSLVLFILAEVYYRLRNKSNSRKWNAMSSEEREAYLVENKDKGNKRYVTVDVLLTL